MLTCRQFLQELNAYLDEEMDPGLRAELKHHLSECPNCWVVCDTTAKTIRVYKGMEAQALPEQVGQRLMNFLKARCKDRMQSHSQVTEQPGASEQSGRTSN